jgi:hypothetical protein
MSAGKNCVLSNHEKQLLKFDCMISYHRPNALFADLIASLMSSFAIFTVCQQQTDQISQTKGFLCVSAASGKL